MSDSGLLLLDTSVVLHVARGKATGEALDRPSACELVPIGR